MAIDHSSRDFGDDYYETLNPAYYFSNVGYLWISRYGYDDVMNIIRTYSAYTPYIDDYHPSFSYIYYFWARNYTLLISDWNFQNNSIFIIYKTTNKIYERFEEPLASDWEIKKNYIQINYTLIYNNDNFEVYITN